MRYKDDYEKFKLILNMIGLAMSFLNLITNYRLDYIISLLTEIGCLISKTFISYLQDTRISIYVFVGLVLLHVDHQRVYTKGECTSYAFLLLPISDGQ